jgi:hypothetical protein
MSKKKKQRVPQPDDYQRNKKLLAILEKRDIEHPNISGLKERIAQVKLRLAPSHPEPSVPTPIVPEIPHVSETDKRIAELQKEMEALKHNGTN